MTDTPEQQSGHVIRALLVAIASCICLTITEVFHLSYSYTSVISVHIIMSNPATTIFQKGLERILGRVVGVYFGLALVMYLFEAPFLFLLVLAIGMLVFFYIYYSGRLSYTGLQGGAFVTIVVVTGLTAPEKAQSVADAMIQQIILGVVVALFLTALTGTETPAFQTAGPPMLPLHLDWLNKAAMLTTAMFVAMGVTIWFDLPVVPSMISAALLGMAPDPAARLTKARQRARGAILGCLYAFAGLILLQQMPHFILFLLLTFLAMFFCSYYTRASKEHSYVFLQMGLAIPMVLIGQTNELGTLSTGFQRFLGVWAGMLASQAVEFLWPLSLTATPNPPAPSPDPALSSPVT